MRMSRRALLAASAGVLAAAKVQAKPKDVPIVLGEIALSFHAVVGGVVKAVAERMGRRVEVVTGPHEEMFPKLASGEVDLLATAWLPSTHSHLAAAHRDRIVELATVYDDARLYWAVPEYVPPTLVRTVDDLKAQEVAARMDRTIRGIGPGAGLMVRSSRMMTEYGLDRAGYALVPGTAKDWIANFEQAVAEGRWMVMPLWQPQFLNRSHKVRVLEEPRGILGTPDRAVLVASRAFTDGAAPRELTTLRRLAIGLDGVTTLDHMANREGLSAHEAARRWMAENKKTVDAWFA